MRYVILRHECPPDAARPSHWDVMFEHDGKLRTWAIETSPDSAEPQPATMLPDHRLDYLTYEGEISGGRGTVVRWDEGSYVTRHDDSAVFVAEVTGRKLRGTIEINGAHYRFIARQP